MSTFRCPACYKPMIETPFGDKINLTCQDKKCTWQATAKTAQEAYQDLRRFYRECQDDRHNPR